MSQRRHRPGNDPRGWLLVEVAVGGVMASVIIGALLVNTGAAMDRTTFASRQMTATMLAQQAIEQSRAAGIALTSSGDIGVPSGLSGRYTRTRNETVGSTTIGTNVINFKEVTVTVSFNTHDYGNKIVTLQTRIYTP
ncbi:MAG: hypothetical protein HYS27_24610 [Deltaproteobacteria bacterium]|nr:hypothetical protein [Deltaproteobacteria bacterium]